MIIRTRSIVLSGLSMLTLMGAVGCKEAAVAADPAPAEPAVTLDTEIKQSSYLLGYRQIESLQAQTQGVLDLEAYLQGARDFVDEAPNQVEGVDEMQLRLALQQALQAKQQEASAAVRADGDKFREEFAAREGVVSLPSGALYEVISAAEGDTPSAEDTVTTHYHGTLIDGTVFDSSVERGEPASFALNRVIPGWTEVLQLMSVGAKWRIVLPPELAYGDRGAGADIPPGATLIFEVELLGIEKAEAQQGEG